MAQELEENGVELVSVDEKTGIQALERAAETKPLRAGEVEKWLQPPQAALTARLADANRVRQTTIPDQTTAIGRRVHRRFRTARRAKPEWAVIA